MIFNFLWAFFFGIFSCQFLAANDFGFVRIMHAANRGGGTLSVKIDQLPAREEGYQFGDLTGGIPLKTGNRRFSISREGLKTTSFSLNVVANETTTVIVYAEKLEDEWCLKTLKLKQFSQEQAQTITFVSVVSEKILEVEWKLRNKSWQVYQIDRLKPFCFENHQQLPYLDLRCRKQKFSTNSLSDSGNGVIVWYEDAQGNLLMKSFLDYSYRGD